MASLEFYDGQEVKELWWPDESCQSVNHDNCDKITVVMECGQMARVPWFAIWKDGKVVYKHNSAHVASVKLLDEVA